MSRIAVITADEDFSHHLRLAANAVSGDVQSFQANFLPGRIGDVLDQLVGDPLEVLVLGPDLQSEEVFRFTTQLSAAHPAVSVIYANSPTPDLALAAMRAGVRDLVRPDADVDALKAHLLQAADSAHARRVLAEPEPEVVQEAHGRVIAVMSPKGGVGKTTIATNLAVGLAKTAPGKVVIVDTDLQFGDVASGLLLQPERTLADAANGPMDSLSLKTYLSLHSSGALVLAAPRNPADADGIPPAATAELVTRLAYDFQYVILDTAPGLGDHVLALLECTHDVVWVCGMDIPSIRGLRNGLDILGEVSMLPPGRHVVLNMEDKHAGITVKDIESTLGVPVDVRIPRSKGIPLTTNRGVPALADSLKDPAVKGFRSLVQRFLPDWEHSQSRRLFARKAVTR